MLRAAVWILPVKVDMGNCCGWCVRCCCHCCCSRCCRQTAAVPEDHHEQLVRDEPKEEPVLTVTEDPSGVEETQEMKVVVEVTELPGTDESTGLMAGQAQTETFAPPAQPLVRGGSGRGSWRLLPAGSKETGPRAATPTEGTEAAEVTFEDPPPPAVREPRNIVLFAHELEDSTELTEVVQSFSFSATEGLSDV